MLAARAVGRAPPCVAGVSGSAEWCLSRKSCLKSAFHSLLTLVLRSASDPSGTLAPSLQMLPELAFSLGSIRRWHSCDLAGCVHELHRKHRYDRGVMFD